MLPPKSVPDDILTVVSTATPESSTSKICEASPAAPIPVATASSPVMATLSPEPPTLAYAAGKETNENAEILSNEIAETATGDTSNFKPANASNSKPAKVLYYLCRVCRCTLFTEKQLSHGQVRR